MVAALDYFSFVHQDDCYKLHVAKISKALLGGARTARPVKSRKANDAPFAKQAVPSDFCQDIVAEQKCYEKHIQEAIIHPHPFNDDGASGITPDLRSAINQVVHLRGSISKWRHHQMVVLRQASRALSHITDILRERQARVNPFAAKVASGLNFGLWAALLDATGWPHDSLLFNLVFGFRVIGEIPDSGLFAAGGQPYRSDLFETLDENAQWASKLIDRCSRNPELSDDDVNVWKKTMEEVEDGLMMGPFTRAHLDDKVFGYGKWRPMARFSVWQKGKLRACDDARRSLHNNITCTTESLVCDRADFPIRMARIFASKISSPFSMLLGTEDLASAYRRVPVWQPEYTVVALKDPSGELKFFIVPGHNFGLLSAVLNFNTVPEFTVHVARRMFASCCSHFYDDFPVCEPSFSCASSQKALWDLHQLLGFALAEKKHVPCALENDYLGIHNDFSQMYSRGEARVRVTDSRRADLIELLTEAIDSGALSPAQAESLHGKLQFAISGSFGKVGRAALLLIRERFRRVSSDDNLSKSLKFGLELLRDIIHAAPDFVLRVLPSSERSTLIWSDAMYNEHKHFGQMGWVLRVPPCSRYGVRYFHSSYSLDRSLLERLFGVRQNYIQQLETLAALTAYTSIDPRLIAGKLILHFVDNQGALSNLISCSSRDYDCSWMVHEFAIIASKLSLGVWFEYVRSAANIADLPSRGEYAYLLQVLRSRWVHTRTPSNPRWVAPAGL